MLICIARNTCKRSSVDIQEEIVFIQVTSTQKLIYDIRLKCFERSSLNRKSEK